MLYSIGASWNPGMSRPNKKVAAILHHNPAAAFGPSVSGLAGIQGLNFSYRLNQWGPKVGPAMVPANDFKSAYLPQGLSGPISWIEGLVGLESAPDMAQDASNTLTSVAASLSPAGTTIQTLIAQAQGYNGAQDPNVQAKAQAAQAEGSGLVSTLATLQTAYQALLTQVNLALQDPNVSKDAAQNLKTQASALEKQVSSLLDNIDEFTSHVNDLEKYAQAGPSVVQGLEGAAINSISTLTWLIGGGALVYFLAPTFVPRMIGGLRKSVRK